MFEAVGGYAAGEITESELREIELSACPGAGSCAGMFTANSMASVAEALGLALYGSAGPSATSAQRLAFARQSGELAGRLAPEGGPRPRQVMTKPAFENAIAVSCALGGSTNVVLHLLAIAAEAHVDLTLDDFARISRRTPQLANLRPAGKYLMRDLDRVGGVPAVIASFWGPDCSTANRYHFWKNGRGGVGPRSKSARPGRRRSVRPGIRQAPGLGHTPGQPCPRGSGYEDSAFGPPLSPRACEGVRAGKEPWLIYLVAILGVATS